MDLPDFNSLHGHVSLQDIWAQSGVWTAPIKGRSSESVRDEWLYLLEIYQRCGGESQPDVRRDEQEPVQPSVRSHVPAVCCEGRGASGGVDALGASESSRFTSLVEVCVFTAPGGVRVKAASHQRRREGRGKERRGEGHQM